jgi:hypothetical protein
VEENDVNITRRLLGKAALGLAGATMLMQFPALAADKPAPFDKTRLKISLMSYPRATYSAFFQAYRRPRRWRRPARATAADAACRRMATGHRAGAGIIIQHGR